MLLTHVHSPGSLLFPQGLYEDPKKGWVEGVAILTAVLAVATVTASNDYSKEQQFRALNAVKEDILIKVVIPAFLLSPPLSLPSSAFYLWPLVVPS